MAQADLKDFLENHILPQIQNRTEFREQYSNRKVHVFKLDSDDIKDQCMKEIQARLAKDKIALDSTTTKKGKKVKAGGLGADFNLKHPLYLELKAVVDDEVPKFVAQMYKILFVGGVKNRKGKVIKLSGIELGIRGKGTPTSFHAVLSPTFKKKGKGAEVFGQFKTKVKQEAQGDLYNALQTVIDNYNVKSPDANIKGLTGKGQSFLDLGHDEGSAVITQRQQRTSDMFFQYAEATEIMGDPGLADLIRGFGAEFLVAVLKKDSKELTELSVSFESKLDNADTVAKGEAGESIFLKYLQDAIDALGAEAYLKLGGSDSRFEIIEKTIVNEFMKNLPKGAKVTRRLPAKINYSSGKRVESKKITTNATVINEAKDNTKIRQKSFKKSAKRGVSSMPLELLGILNDKLPETVRRNMIPPALQDQTGRFANSVKVTEIAQTPKGFPSIGYTYDRDNYEQYEITSGSSQWANSDRDPRKLIDASIREIAAQTALGRFFTRRV